MTHFGVTIHVGATIPRPRRAEENTKVSVICCSALFMFPNLISSVQKEASKGVIVAFIIAEETPNGQVDGHLVPSVQVDGRHDGGAVFLILHVLLVQLCHIIAVHLQSGAGGQRVAGGTGVAVDGEGQAVDARAGSGEDACLRAVAVTQVHEDVAVGDELVVAEGAEARQSVLIVESHREGAAAGCGSGGEGGGGLEKAPF